MSKEVVLVTGGAGYIGSHAVRSLLEEGVGVVVVDNLSTGFQEAIPVGVEFVHANVGDSQVIEKILLQHQIKSVLHFAGHLSVEESVRDPLKYYKNNTLQSTFFIEACLKCGVENFIFSSTCAVYGNPIKVPVPETESLKPESPYGFSKRVTEELLKDIQKSEKYPHFKSVSLRYFNVAGAHDRLETGMRYTDSPQILPRLCNVILGRDASLKIFGTDYPTPDGTCVRDYIHVQDLAEAHVSAFKYLKTGGASEVFNLGYGKGFSVREVVECMKKVSGVNFKVEECPRRPGDVVSIYCDATHTKNVLKWNPKRDNLELICRSHLEFAKKLTRS